jgi:5-methyltetrahydrofolate--homocysteine methyltransferase
VKRFKDWEHPVKGNNDLLSLTQPQAIEEVHRKYLEAGADIMKPIHFQEQPLRWQIITWKNLVYELNYESAKLPEKPVMNYTAKSG